MHIVSNKLLLSVLFFFLFSTFSFAQSPSLLTNSSQAEALPSIENITSTEARDLLSRLSDKEVREILLTQLDAASANNDAGASNRRIGDTISSALILITTSIYSAIVSLPEIIKAVFKGFSSFADKNGWNGFGILAGVILLSLLTGYIAEICVNQFATKWRNQIRTIHEDATLKETLRVLTLRFFVDIAGLVAFFAAASLIGKLFMPESLHPSSSLIVSNLIVLPRLVSAAGRFILAPQRSDLRMVHANDISAKFLHKNIVGLAFLAGFLNWLVHFLNNNGVPIGEVRIGFWLLLFFYLWLAYTVFHEKSALTVMMAGKSDGPASKIENLISRFYPWFSIVAIALTWVLVESLVAHDAWHLLDGRAEISLLILLTTPVMDSLIRAVVSLSVKPIQGEGALAIAAYQSTKNCYFRIGRVISFAIAIIFISALWEIDYSRLAAAGIGARTAGVLFQFLFIVAVGYLIWEVVSLWINKKLAAEMTASEMELNNGEPSGGEGGGAGSSRLTTVLPLVRFTLQAAIITITLLVALGEVGIEIAPLLAGAGIIGLAVGFGAQKLVADIVSGIFFLVDDAFRAGEYLDVSGTFGTVEKISLRSLQLRHHKGPVHTIPYGEIPKITNYSRDWVIVKLPFTVPFDTDLNKVKKLFKMIGIEMMEVPEFAEDFLQPFKSQGVLEVNDVGIVVRGKFMAKPGKQFVLRKEIYSRVQKAFDANGIQFARKEVRVKIDGDTDNITEDDRRKVAAAASEAAEQPAPEGGGKEGPPQ